MVAATRDAPPRPHDPVIPLARPAQPDVMTQILHEQRKTNELLVMLIEALSESEDDPDAEPMTYMDGSPVR